MANRHKEEAIRTAVSEHLGFDTRDKQLYQVYDEEVYQRRLVHTFAMADVDDPHVYVASPIYDWQQTEHGKWVMKHGRDPTYHILADPISFGHKVAIYAHITPKRWTEYVLRGWYQN